MVTMMIGVLAQISPSGADCRLQVPSKSISTRPAGRVLQALEALDNVSLPIGEKSIVHELRARVEYTAEHYRARRVLE